MMGSRTGGAPFPSLLKDCVLWFPGTSSAVTTTAKTITANGNATQSTAVTDPWGLARPVGYFDGNGGNVSFANTTSGFIDFTNPMTIEFRVKINVKDVAQIIMQNDYVVTTHSAHIIGISSGNLLYVTIRPDSNPAAGNVSDSLYSTTVFTTDTWYYVALTISSNVGKLFINGNLEATVTYSENAEPPVNTAITRVGSKNDASYSLNGYLSEFRISNTVRYTTNFTPSTTRFKPDINTKLLLHMYGSGATFVDDPFIDVDEFPIIPSGVSVTNNGTFTKTSLGNNKSVLNFDGSTNYISLSDNTAWAMFEGDFTVAGWTNFSSVANARIFCSQYADANNYWNVGWGSNVISLFGNVSGSTTFSYSCPLTPSTSTWYHIVLVRSGSSCLMYINGVSQTVTASTAWTGTTDISAVFRIGERYTNYMNGSLKDLMIYKGRALTQPEIKLLMNRTHPETGAGLMPANGEYYKLS